MNLRCHTWVVVVEISGLFWHSERLIFSPNITIFSLNIIIIITLPMLLSRPEKVCHTSFNRKRSAGLIIWVNNIKFRSESTTSMKIYINFSVKVSPLKLPNTEVRKLFWSCSKRIPQHEVLYASKLSQLSLYQGFIFNSPSLWSLIMQRLSYKYKYTVKN